MNRTVQYAPCSSPCSTPTIDVESCSATRDSWCAHHVHCPGGAADGMASCMAGCMAGGTKGGMAGWHGRDADRGHSILHTNNTPIGGTRGVSSKRFFSTGSSLDSTILYTSALAVSASLRVRPARSWLRPSLSTNLVTSPALFSIVLLTVSVTPISVFFQVCPHR